MVLDEVKVDILKTRIYLEGVLFPYVKRLSISDTEGGVSCNMEIPPSPAIKVEDLIGMTCEVYYANLRVIDLFGNEKSNGYPSDKGWPLLFQGEFMAESSTNGVSSESLNLSFRPLNRHFDQTLLYFYDPLSQNTNTAIAAQAQATFIGNSVIQLDTDGVLSRQSQIINVLEARLRELEDLPEGVNMAFQVAVLEILRSARQNHVLFGLFDDKFKLSDRFAAYSDPDVRKILQLTQFKNLVENYVSKMPAYTSLTKILEMCTSIMQYNWNDIAQPRLVRPASDTIQNPNNVSTRPEIFNRYADQLIKGIIKYSASKPKSLFGFINNIPEKYWSDGGRPVLIGEFTNILYSKYDTALQNLGPDISIPDEGRRILIEDAIADMILNEGIRPVFSKSDKVEDPDPDAVFGSAIDEIKKKANAQKPDNPAAAVNPVDADRAQNNLKLNQYAVLPSLEFAQPPVCNIFFPSEFQLYGISKDYMSELTRLYATVFVMPNQSSGGEALTEWYIAPSSQAYHYLDDGYASKISDEYKEFTKDNLTVTDEQQDG